MSILSNLLRELIFGKPRTNTLHQSSDQIFLSELLEIGHDKLKASDIAGAEKICADALKRFPENAETNLLFSEIEFVKCSAAVEKRFPGPTYLDWLKWFHATLKPAAYLEVGVESGRSLQFARSPTRAVGVDPALQIVYPQEAWVKLYQLPSDDFFANHDLRQVLEVKTVSLAFIDGLHTFDQALKDFMNIEKFSDAGTVVLFHDIFPVTAATAKRDRSTKFWVGDTWKVIPILMKFRPDLKVFTIPTYPSGLGVVTGLNADSTTLWNDFELIRDQTMAFELDTFQPKIDDHLNLVENDFAAVLRLL
ncbi:MAG TPA: class I SAM-dependent methyltransferase [Polaromonas sp.]|uniref:class I SAM-dependent methyltransferase n=1 Tax=Polaromonas sp. TaxID=1869339 RepID=UPI002D550A28|nr:class I SAM-dependent methyltransferase [Polaromonas sp.]HYW56923.1 class I SAM-dependent methyltransferase [Polaromonas sp.]